MALQMTTVEYEIPGSVDGTTLAPAFSFDPKSPDYKAPDPDGIVRFSAEEMLALTGGNFGLFDPDFGVGGAFADRFLHLIEVRTGGGGAAAQIVIVDARDPALAAQEEILAPSPEIDFTRTKCVFVPQGSAVAFSGFNPVVGQPVIVRINVVAWGSVEDYASLLSQCCCQSTSIDDVPTLAQVLDAGNETDGTGFLATPDNTVDAGSTAARFRSVVSRMSLAVALLGAGTPTASFGADSVGRIHGTANAIAAGSVATLQISNPASPGLSAVAVDAVVQADIAGSVAQAIASGPGASVRGYVRAETAHTASMSATAQGSHASGYVHADGFNATMLSSARGTHVFGYTKSYPGAGYGVTTLQATGDGSTAIGAVAYFGEITASARGSLARGFAAGGPFVQSRPGKILATGEGSFVSGVAEGGTLEGGYACFVHGRVRSTTSSSGAAPRLFAENRGFIFGSAQGPNALLHTLNHSSVVLGTAISYAANAYPSIETLGNQAGNFAGGLCGAYAARTARISAEDNGAFAWGYCFGTTGNAYIRATLEGAMATGFAYGSILATAEGARAHGRTLVGRSITASGQGSRAGGNAATAVAGQDITASGIGSFAFGNADSAGIVASASNAFQFGPGTNSVADSVRIGAAGLHLKQTAGAFGAAADGQIWVNGGNVYIRSGGATRNCTNIP